MEETIADRIIQHIGERYHENEMQISDSGVDSQELNRFYDHTIRNAFGRTGLSMDMVQYSFKRRRTDEAFAPVGEGGGKEVVRISLVSSGLPISEGDGSWLKPRAFEDSRKILVATKQFNRNEWCLGRSGELLAALRAKPDIICYPEFAYPPPALGRTYAESGEMTSAYSTDASSRNEYMDRSSYGRNRHNYETEIKKLIKTENQPFLFLGSYHCPFDFYNIGVVFPLGSDDTTFRVKTESSELDDDGKRKVAAPEYIVAPPVLYRKRFPARRVQEFARVPSNMEFHTYRIDGVHIALMICSDVLDLNQCFNLARINKTGNEAERIDIILVPAFNRSAKLASMCRELSFLTGATVVFVNANDCLSDFSRSDVFVCGFSRADLQALGEKSKEIVVDVSEDQIAPVRKELPWSRVLSIDLNLKFAGQLRDRVSKLIGSDGSGRSGVIYG